MNNNHKDNQESPLSDVEGKNPVVAQNNRQKSSGEALRRNLMRRKKAEKSTTLLHNKGE